MSAEFLNDDHDPPLAVAEFGHLEPAVRGCFSGEVLVDACHQRVTLRTFDLDRLETVDVQNPQVGAVE